MEYGKDYFETNVQNLVIDFVYKDIQTKELEHMLVRTKGILLHLKLSGIKDFDNDKYADSIKYINDYLKTGVFKVSIMNEDSKQWVTKLAPLREAVSKCYIALSPLAAVRDTIAGFLSNNLRAASKYKTDIDVSDVLWAY
jgi:hypothetical protein